MAVLNTKQLSVPQTVPPNIVVQFVKPLSYEFRVAETLDADGKIAKVGLQMQIWEHDEWGTSTLYQFWQDVPRITIDAFGNVIPK